jgi:hypothetical protein
MGYSKWYRNFVRKYKNIGNLKRVTKGIKRREVIIKKVLRSV